ncbi:MAG: hypothetical protein KAI17_12095, partial [Thiotrichaceae bacterium]|nr:hypothetical protein [Thiotrichaceae bacterium]
MLKLINSNIAVIFFMKKTPRQKKSSLVKKIAIAVVALLLVAGAVQAYKKSPSKSLSIINNWIEKLDDPKEENVGCCLPHCAELDKTVCKQSAGGTWVKGSCENLDECKMGCCQYDCKVEQMEHDPCNAVNGEW